MQVFEVRDNIVNTYKTYTESFLNIRDETTREFVNKKLKDGHLWSEPLIQINPNYKAGAKTNELVNQGQLHPECNKIFFNYEKDIPYNFYKHQVEAIEIAQKNLSYVVTTGTGSGKSLTYIVPIINDLLQNPEPKGVRAVLVYPMNALINSQCEEIEKFLRNSDLAKERVKFARYTGQEDFQKKIETQQDVPNIILTNYVMLELMLTRRQENVFFENNFIKYLVLDELHTYRGRQGADVSLLVRRLRERINNPDLICIGTSATMSSQGGRQDKKRVVAEVASRLFGTHLDETQVVDETLERATKTDDHFDRQKLKEAIEKDIEETITKEEFLKNPFISWIENNIGLETEDDFLIRKRPITIHEAASKLVEETGLHQETCVKKLVQVLQLGNRIDAIAFRLHQFISQGGEVYSTLEPPENRTYSLDGQVYTKDDKFLYPMVFCRDCGQAYYKIYLNEKDHQIIPLIETDEIDQDEASKAYFTFDVDGLWDEYNYELLPDNWVNETKTKGLTIKKDYREHIPRKFYVTPDGKITDASDSEGTPVWVSKYPFLLCLQCGATYPKQKSEFTKLAPLSSEGRSSATTLMCMASIIELIQSGENDINSKILSFTDNRQDASLQAGHFNDFVQTTFLRAALCSALKEKGDLTHDTLASRVFEKMSLPQDFYAKEAGERRLEKRNREAFISLIEYRLYQDLKKGWRFTQPNLEQCGLLEIEYDCLEDLCQENDPTIWNNNNILINADFQTRYTTIKAFLDYLRKEMAIDAELLRDNDSLKKKIRQTLKEPWTFDEDERLEEAKSASLEPSNDPYAKYTTVKLSPKSKIAQYLKSSKTWNLKRNNLNNDEYLHLMKDLIEILIKEGYLTGKNQYQLRIDSMVWKAVDEEFLKQDPVRFRRQNYQDDFKVKVNEFYKELYLKNAAILSSLNGKEHTGQVSNQNRIDREELFRDGKLKALFCSPTMELGIDIKDLSIVHMRNIPPNAANYSQRSGRAGRGGQGALVLTYASKGSAHDQYFFNRQQDIVAGSVVAPRFDLSNKQLTSSHIHSIWLSYIGGALLNQNMAHLFDLHKPELPLNEDIWSQLELSEEKIVDCINSSKIVLRNLPVDDDEIEEMVRKAKHAFDKACERWRDEYKKAISQRDQARKQIDNYHRGDLTNKIEEAEALEREAKRRIDILLGRSQDREVNSDFYPFRYFAAEGFLPGYNFPKIPIRNFIPTFDGGEYISRPRFLAIREFAPHNIIYHEGNRYAVRRLLLPASGIDAIKKTAKLCTNCGYYHENMVDICEGCHANLDVSNSVITNTLIEMPTTTSKRNQRITCEEEERLKWGYDITTNYRFSHKPEIAITKNADNNILSLRYGSAAEIWRINHGLKKSQYQGFLIDKAKGSVSDSEEDEKDLIRLLVSDIQNIMLINPINTEEKTFSEAELLSLMYALLRSIEVEYQLETNEIACELINNTILLWEASEGGSGVLKNLVNDPKSISRLAKKAYEICHFIEDDPDCARACYDCLLSYSNQPYHFKLDRNLIKNLLEELMDSLVEKEYQELSREEKYEILRQNTDPLSSLEREFLDYLYNNCYNLPDHAQMPFKNYNCQPDFYYERTSTCIFCNGSVHDQPTQREKDQTVYANLDDLGYRVIPINYNEDWKSVIDRYSDIFGKGTKIKV